MGRTGRIGSDNDERQFPSTASGNRGA